LMTKNRLLYIKAGRRGFGTWGGYEDDSEEEEKRQRLARIEKTI